MRYYIDGYLEILNDNYKKAYDIYKAGIEKGDLNAEFGLAEMYYNGWYVEKDEQRAIQIFNKIYKPIHRKAKWHKNDSESQLIIFCLSEWDEQIKYFKDDFFEMLKKSSGDITNPIAQWYMAEKNFDFCGYSASTLVRIHYERAAACPNTNRYKFDLAMYYMHGTNGVPKDEHRAFYWCKLSAEEGYIGAQLELSKMYAFGCGTQIALKEAVKWRNLAVQGKGQDIDLEFRKAIYECDQRSLNLDSEEALVNMIEMHKMGYEEEPSSSVYLNSLPRFKDNLHTALFNKARRHEKSSSLQELQTSAECYKYLRLVDVDSFDRVFVGELGKVFCRMAVIQNEYGQERETLQSYLEAAEAFVVINKNSHTHETELADVYCNIAAWYEKHNQITETISYYDRATEYMASSDSASLYCKIAELAESFQKGCDSKVYYSKAIDKYIEAVKKFEQPSFFKKGMPYFMYDLAVLCYSGKAGIADYSNALYFFKKCTTLGVEEGKSHYYIGSCFYWGLGVPVDYENAKKHFMQAYEYGFNCNSAISLVESELDNGETINSMRNYAESLKKKQLTEEARYAQIIKDLQADFGDAWNKTQADTKKFIATGIDIYISQYFKGPHIFGNYDFSASINEMCKALENELRVHLYSNYISWLQSRGITPNEFLEANNISLQNVKRSILKRVNSTEYAYEDASKTDKFTLGSVHLTVGKEKGRNEIDRTMLDYLDFSFGDNDFKGDLRMQEINKYILSLVDDLWTISELYRNPAAHSRKMDCKKAEACGDYIIKVKKLLIHFLDKLNL